MKSPLKIAIIGSGTWATALAKILLMTQKHLHWYIRRPEQVEKFRQLGHNPLYLSSVSFNLDRITFYSDINEVVRAADMLLLAVPSPFFEIYIRGIDGGY